MRIPTAIVLSVAFNFRVVSLVVILTLVAIAPRALATTGTLRRAMPAAATPTMPGPPLAEFVAEIPFSTDLDGAPSGLAVDRQGTLFVIDAFTNQIRVFDREHRLVATWGKGGDAPGQFRFLEAGYWGDVALGPDGNLYVLDTFNHRVQVLNADGAFLRQWGERGSALGQFYAPQGIAVAGDGRVYVVDTTATRVQIFDADGTFLAAWTPKVPAGQFVALADIAIGHASRIWVTDNASHRIYQVDVEAIEGKEAIVASIGDRGTIAAEFTNPWGITADPRGNLYVADYGGHQVHVLAPDGTPLGTIGSVGAAPGQFMGPLYLTVGENDLLYVADEGNARVQVFRLLPPLVPAVGTPVPA